MNKSKKYIIFLLSFLLSCSSPAKLPTTFQGEVTHVVDGDTIDVLYNANSYRIRLADIDCPEDDQPFGDSATKFVSDLCLSKLVTVENKGEWDMYGRLIATIIVRDTLNVNLALVKMGLAWHYKQYSDKKEYSDIEEEARKKHIMLWSDSNAIAPWDWR